MKVKLIAQTTFRAPIETVPWVPDDSESTGGTGGQDLVEFAGRACYQSWSRPNPKTASNDGYLAHILDVGHYSVLEHASATFYVEGVSRSLTHELVRHRHLSFSQLSQRYVDASTTAFVPPPVIRDNEYLRTIFEREMDTVREAYEAFATLLAEEFPAAKRKEIRQAARAVLPNATETKIVVTGNFRAWRDVITLRGTEAADVEIRALAVELLRQLWSVAPNVFRDLAIVTLEDGTEGVEPT